MAPFGTIWSYPGNFRVQRVEVIAALNGLELTHSDFTMGVTNTTPEFLSKFPMGKVPAFEGADGFCLAEGAAIAAYIASAGPKKTQLLGSDAKTIAKIAEWIMFTDTELVAHMTTPLLMCLYKYWPYEEARYAASASAFERAVRRVEVALVGGKKYLVGEELTLADLMVAPVLFYAGKFLLDAEFAKTVPATVAYLKGLAEAVPEFKKVFGELELCATRAKA